MSLVAAIIIALVLRGLYHKVFDVTYFGFGAFIRELFIFFVIGIIIASCFFG